MRKLTIASSPSQAHHRNRLIIAVLLTVLGVAVPAQHAFADVILIDFDSVDTSTAPVDATSHLAANGITLTGITPSGTPVLIRNDIDLFGGNAITPSSNPNVLLHSGGPATAHSFTMEFNTPLDSLTFTRVQLDVVPPTGVTHPQWSATAFDALNLPLDSVGENLISSFQTVPAATFTLNGPGITSVQIQGNAFNFAGFTSAVLDDFQLKGDFAPVPEPTSLAIWGIVGLGGAFCGWWRKRRSAA